MGRLFLVDQSLTSLGGHHFDYVNCVAKAACGASLKTIVGANRRFSGKGLRQSDTDTPLFRSAEVLSSFRNTTYQKVSWLAGLRHLKRAKVPIADGSETKTSWLSPSSWLRMRSNRVFRSQRRKVIAQFACDCNRFFRAASAGEFKRGDQVFLTTVSELEMMGLAIFLATAPSSRHATWHLQFHYNLLDGRPAEFDSQSVIQRKVRGCFLAALSRVPDHDLRFYCTSEELAEQYARLRVARFSTLAYPINPAFAPTGVEQPVAKSNVAAHAIVGHEERQTEQTAAIGSAGKADLHVAKLSGPARMIVPGELRREKGALVHLQGIVDDLWEDYLSVGRLQLAVQRPRRRMVRGEKLELEVPENAGGSAVDQAIEYLRHPLPETDYCEFIRGCDFGLLLHDSRAYYSRRAGVLGELMSCGKPVIVPAGCWLAHQLQEPLFRHIEDLRSKLPASRRFNLSDLKFDSSNAPLGGGVVSFDRARHPFRFSAEKNATEKIAIVHFSWLQSTNAGVNARLRCTEFRNHEKLVSTVQVVGCRQSSELSLALIRLSAESNRLQFELENAFDDSTAAIRNLKVEYFSPEHSHDVRLGVNGLIYGDKESIRHSIVEIVDNLDHYRYNAREFAGPWWKAHDPCRTLDQLFESEVVRRVA